MPGQASSRSLSGRPNLRHLKLEAKRRLAAGEFPTLHEAQVAIAREHGLPSWAALKRHISENQDGHALDQLRWIISRFAGADEPGWTAPADDELNQHFDDRFLAALPPPALVAAIGRVAADLRDGELVVLGQTPVQAYVELNGVQYIAVAAAEPPHRLIGLRGVPVGLDQSCLNPNRNGESYVPAVPDRRPAAGTRKTARPASGQGRRNGHVRRRGRHSTYWTLLVAVVTPIGLSALVAVTLANPPGPGAAPDPLLPGLLSLEYAVLAVGVLGVLAFSTEYSTGLIRTTFASVPRRRAVLAAKAAVIGAVTLVAGEVVAFVSFGLVQAVLSGKHLGVSLSHPGVAGAVLAAGLLLFVVATMGLGLGAIVRHTAGGIAALVGLIFLPAILGLLPAPWGGRVGRFTLLDAARQVTALHPATNLFAPAWSFLAPRGHTSCAEMIQRACARAGFVPRVVARATDFAVLLSLVAAGAGLTLVPELATRNLPAGVRLLSPAEPVTRQIFTVSRRGGDRKPAVRVVLDALADAARDRPVAA